VNKYLISYSLYGSNKRYVDALIANIDFINLRYSEIFSLMIVIGEGVPEHTVKKISESNVIVVSNEEKELRGIWPDFYRHYPVLSYQGLGCFFRDADSYLSVNEIESMIRFIKSDYTYHIVRDHPKHLAPIMGGLFGIKSMGYEKVKKIFLEHCHKYDFSSKSDILHLGAARGDQLILADYVYPFIYKESYIESNFTIFVNELPYIKPCKIKKVKESFMGQIDPNYNSASENENDLLVYNNSGRRLYPPYFMLKLFRYRFIYRIYWSIN